MASSSLYELLGIQAGASCKEIKAAYRKLARVCHPDVVSVNLKEKSADDFMKIHAAYSTLSDPNKRRDYDRYLSLLRTCSRRSSSLGSAATGFSTCRNWETDQCW